MKNTRFMDRLFSAVEEGDEELTNQVANDIEDAKANGVVDTPEVKYENVGDGRVNITDKETGEVTVAEKATDEAETYDLSPAVPDGELERFLHPSADGVHPGNQVGAPDEKVENHFGKEDVIAPNKADGGLNPDAGHEKSVTEIKQPCPECGEEPCKCGKKEDEKEFSVTTDNSVVLRIFSDQEFCERIFSEVIESEDTAVVGDLKVEKIPEEENTVVATNTTTGDQAKIKLEDNEMKVTELESKNFCDENEFKALHIVGIDPVNHILVDASEYNEESANELVNRLEEDGVDAVKIFDNPNDARDYAFQLLGGAGVESEEDIDEPQEVEYSETGETYCTRYYSSNTEIMDRMFSDAVNGIADLQDTVNDAIHSGDEIETDGEIVTPVDAITAIIEDKGNGETTKAVIDGEDMRLEPISNEDAQDMMGDLTVMEVDDDYDEDEDENNDEEDEKDFSDIYCNESETRFFSANEEMSNYMIRLFSEEADQDTIEDAIANGSQIETDKEIITPVDAKTAVIEDKENGEFTKAEIEDETIDVKPISKEEASELTEDTNVSKDEKDEDKDDKKEDEKDFSDIYCNESETRFFSANEEMTNYMVRLYSEEADQNTIEDAIANGSQIETDNEVITPIDSKAAIVEDKENGEFTKITLDDEIMNVHPISEEEADNLTEGLNVEEEGVDEDEKNSEKEENKSEKEENKSFSDMTDYMIRLFSEEAAQDTIEDAIANGDEVETDKEIITPVDDKTAVVEDKESGEFTKAEIDDETINVKPISKEEASELTKDVKKEESKEETAEKKFSNVYAKDGVLDKFFSDIAMGQQAPASPQASVQDPAENEAPVEQSNVAKSVEQVEDLAAAAVQNIQAAAEQAAATIMEAKAAPAPNAEPDLQEAQFSENINDGVEEKTFSETDGSPLISWLSGINNGR